MGSLAFPLVTSCLEVENGLARDLPRYQAVLSTLRRHPFTICVHSILFSPLVLTFILPANSQHSSGFGIRPILSHSRMCHRIPFGGETGHHSSSFGCESPLRSAENVNPSVLIQRYQKLVPNSIIDDPHAIKTGSSSHCATQIQIDGTYPICYQRSKR